MPTPSCLTAWLALTRTATPQPGLPTLLHRKRQPRVLRHGFDLLSSIGLVVQEHVAAAAPDVCTHRGECHLGVDELRAVSMEKAYRERGRKEVVMAVTYLAVAVKLKVLVRA